MPMESSMKYETILLGLSMAFVTCLLVSNVVAGKIIGVGVLGTISAGIVCYPLTFLFTDTISELFGKQRATTIVWIGFGCNILLVGLILLAGFLPHAIWWEGQEAFMQTLGFVPRVVLASMVAYIISQNLDVLGFHYLKEKTNGKYLWLRNNVSTMFSQSIDTILFIGIAFLGVFPLSVVINMMIFQYIVKLIIAACDTPFVYLLVMALKERIGHANS